MDEPDEKFIISWILLAYSLFDSNASHCPFSSQCLTTFTITDDDPTVVSIARVGSGAVSEGGKIEFTVTLGRALVAGEIVDVPLSISGTNVTGGDWSLALKPGATNTGVARRIGGVRFSGAGAQTATLELTAVDDGTADHNETFNIALGADADFDDPGLGTNVGGGADPHSSNNAFSVTVNDPPPSVSVHTYGTIGREGVSDSASVRLRLSAALRSGESLTVTYRLDTNAQVKEFADGVTVTHTAGNQSTGTVTFTGPTAPQEVLLYLSPAANSVNRWASGVKAVDFALTAVSGLDGAAVVAAADKVKVFVNDSAVTHHTTLGLSGGGHVRHEGREVWVTVNGKAGRKAGSPAPYGRYEATLGVQHLTTGFDDLGHAYAGHDTWVKHLRRDGDTDYYNVVMFGWVSAQVRIPIMSDGAGEGDERFRVFIAETPDYMGVKGFYGSQYAAPGMDFTIKGQPGGGQRDAGDQAVSPPAPTRAVSNVQVTAVDAANAKVTWDAVEHATSYEVEYETTSALTDTDNYVQGVAFDWTDTSWTFRHDAAEAMTLTVTVTPVHEDENGGTQVLAELAGTATIDVGPAGTGGGDAVGDGGTGGGDSGTGDPPPASSCVGDGQWDTVAGYYGSNANKSPNYGANWYRVLIAYRLEDADRALPAWTGATERPTAAFTVGEAEDEEAVWSGWTPVREVLECLRDANRIGRSFVPLVPAASHPAREGVVRFVNASPRGGSVRIQATDDSGWRPAPVTLRVGPGASIQLTSRDLERGNAAKGLSGGMGSGTGDWRLDVSGDPGIEVRPHVRSADGRLAAMGAVAPVRDGAHRVAVLHPADGAGRTGLLRLANRRPQALGVRITALDDGGSPGGAVSLKLPARAAATFTASELERGGSGLDGALGDGDGLWRLRVASSGPLAVMALAEDPAGRLANLSDPAPAARLGSGVHAVAGFPSAYGPAGRPGMLRIVNGSAAGGAVTIRPYDAAGRALGPVRLRLAAGGAANLDAWDLELGNPAKGLSGGAGPAPGDWRIEVESGLDLRVLPLIETRFDQLGESQNPRR